MGRLRTNRSCGEIEARIWNRYESVLNTKSIWFYCISGVGQSHLSVQGPGDTKIPCLWLPKARLSNTSSDIPISITPPPLQCPLHIHLLNPNSKSSSLHLIVSANSSISYRKPQSHELLMANRNYPEPIVRDEHCLSWQSANLRPSLEGICRWKRLRIVF